MSSSLLIIAPQLSSSFIAAMIAARAGSEAVLPVIAAGTGFSVVVCRLRDGIGLRVDPVVARPTPVTIDVTDVLGRVDRWRFDVSRFTAFAPIYSPSRTLHIISERLTALLSAMLTAPAAQFDAAGSIAMPVISMPEQPVGEFAGVDLPAGAMPSVSRGATDRPLGVPMLRRGQTDEG